MISSLPTYSWASIRVRREWRLFALAGVALLGAVDKKIVRARRTAADEGEQEQNDEGFQKSHAREEITRTTAAFDISIRVRTALTTARAGASRRGCRRRNSR